MPNLPIFREQALELLKKWPQNEADLRHYLMSEAIMGGVAKKLGEDVGYWQMLGLLHDVDWALTKENTKEHGTKAEEILKEQGFDNDFIEIIKSHIYGYEESPVFRNKVREKKIEHALAASETLTGLIYAYALMRGNMISGMEVKGLKKKFKDKTFAAGCNRDIIREIEKVGLSLDDFFEIGIKALQEIKDEIGLN